MTITLASAAAEPIVIAHRGASGDVPEHTLAAYFVAIEQGADFIEPDLVLTRDGVLVARHENEIGGTTDVASRPEFAARRTTKMIDGERVTGWFTEDFTLAELKTLRARERLPELRRASARFDGQFEIPTFEEVLQLLQSVDTLRRRRARMAGLPRPARIGVYPETKHPSYFESLGLSFDRPLLRLLERYGYRSRRDPAFIQSFETANLRRLRSKTALRLVQLVASSGRPYDFVVSGDPRSYTDLLSAAGLAEIAGYAAAIGPQKDLVVSRNADGSLGSDTGLARRAHQAGLTVHVWTLRAENQFLPADLRRGTSGAEHGNLAAEIAALLDAGVNGIFTDQPAQAVRARDDWLARRQRSTAVRSR
ncbi:MAG: glycerophosphodiester phosphodiesterase [Steroidobacteraceae bacterium]|nr:glycerophosphodiester phosphodiesterase [Steroidobacteraceae bacterium]MDW8257869.1 glycerophosphodiester phosphodiesterase [Gammaproteobacteria bacterium]